MFSNDKMLKSPWCKTRVHLIEQRIAHMEKKINSFLTLIKRNNNKIKCEDKNKGISTVIVEARENRFLVHQIQKKKLHIKRSSLQQTNCGERNKI